MGCFKGKDSRNWGKRPILDSTNPIQDLDSSSLPAPVNSILYENYCVVRCDCYVCRWYVEEATYDIVAD